MAELLGLHALRSLRPVRISRGRERRRCTSRISIISDMLSYKPTHHKSKGKYVRRLVELSFEVRLWAAPVIVSSEHSFDASAFGQMSDVFQIGELNLFDACIVAAMVTVYHDVIRFDIW